MEINRCPKCNIKMLNNCCVRCGYMINGNYSNQKLESKYEELKLYNKSFEKMNYNKNKTQIFILESSYFSYRDHLLFGILLGIVDSIVSIFLISLMINYIKDDFIIIYVELIIVYIFIKKIIYVIFANTVCLKLDYKKIEKIKKNNINYKDILIEHKDKSKIKLIISLLIYIVVVITVFTSIN